MTNPIILLATQPAGDSNAELDESLNGLVDLAKMGLVFVGGYFSHWLLLRRDRQLRKRAFISIMTQLENVVLHVWPRGGFVINYRNSIRNIVRAAAPVVADFSESKGVELQRMINDLCRHSGAEAQSNQKKLLGEIDAITRFFASEA